jgi:hypothetical protein
MDAGEFEKRTTEIVNWFASLNPYEFGGSILKIEDQNYSLTEKTRLEPLYCWAVSAKRYALFNLSPDTQPIMRKVSAHGLGHLRAPYGPKNPPAHIPAPHPSVLASGIERWHSDLWFQIVGAALTGHPDRVEREYHPALASAAVSRYGATTPDLLRWFKRYNEKRPYRQQVKPFSFLLSLQASLPFDEEEILADASRRPRRTQHLKPVALFNPDSMAAAASAFDRDTGKAVPPARLKSYADALSDYHIHPESKFENGDRFDTGTTRRRHVRVATVQHIGKEANDWERQAVLGFESDSLPTYGVEEADPARLARELRSMIARWGISRCARAFGISATTLAKMVSCPSVMAERTRQQVASRVAIAKRLLSRLTAAQESATRELGNVVRRDGLRATARRLGVDPSNLRRKIARDLLP